MPYQADYVLRLIQQLSGLIRGAKQRLDARRSAESEEVEGQEVAGEAIGLVLGMDPLVASRLTPPTLAAMLQLGEVHQDVLPLLAEAIEVDAQSLEAGGRPAAAVARRAQADAVRSLMNDRGR
jgi:hypothetical protein